MYKLYITLNVFWYEDVDTQVSKTFLKLPLCFQTDSFIIMLLCRILTIHVFTSCTVRNIKGGGGGQGYGV